MPVATSRAPASHRRRVVSHRRHRLAAYKRPRIVEVRGHLPVGPTGKVLRPLRAAPSLQAA